MIPSVYVVKSSHALNAEHYKLARAYGSKIFLVEFGEGDLTSPYSDPIVISYENGCRRYLWKNGIYGEVDVSRNDVVRSMLKYHEEVMIFGLLEKYWHFPPPNKRDILSDPIMNFVRIIYNLKTFKPRQDP